MSSPLKKIRSVTLCTFWKDNGEKCGSPAMGDLKFCYHHRDSVKRRQRMRKGNERRLKQLADLVADRQLGLATRDLYRLLIDGVIDREDARLLLRTIDLMRASMKQQEKMEREQARRQLEQEQEQPPERVRNPPPPAKREKQAKPAPKPAPVETVFERMAASVERSMQSEPIHRRSKTVH